MTAEPGGRLKVNPMSRVADPCGDRDTEIRGLIAI